MSKKNYKLIKQDCIKWMNENPNHRNPIENDTWMNQEFSFFDENGNFSPPKLEEESYEDPE